MSLAWAVGLCFGTFVTGLLIGAALAAPRFR